MTYTRYTSVTFQVHVRYTSPSREKALGLKAAYTVAPKLEAQNSTMVHRGATFRAKLRLSGRGEFLLHGTPWYVLGLER